MTDFDEEPTRRMYRTDHGVVDWDSASNAAQAVARGSRHFSHYALLAALFRCALERGRVVNTDGGPFDETRAISLLAGLRTAPTDEGLDELWGLLHVLFRGSHG